MGGLSNSRGNSRKFAPVKNSRGNSQESAPVKNIRGNSKSAASTRHTRATIWMILPLYIFTLIFVACPLIYMVALSFATPGEVHGVQNSSTYQRNSFVLNSRSTTIAFRGSKCHFIC